MTAIKSMGLFYIDNQGAWPSGSQLVGDLVLWEDKGKYPTYVPVSIATHPNFDGKIVVHAGNRGLLVSFVFGAQSEKDIGQALKTMEGVAQYRIAIDAIVHRLVLHLNDGEVRNDADALSLAAWMATQSKSRPYAQVIRAALATLLANPQALSLITEQLRAQHNREDLDAFSIADALSETIAQSIATKDVAEQAPDVATLRRKG